MSTWFKFFNDLVDDPRYVALSDAAWTLHIHGMAYCSKNLTDGFIPTAMIHRLCGTKKPLAAAGELAAAGLWSETDNGWRIVGYLDGQRSRKSVEDEREANRKKMADYRAAKASKKRNDSSNAGCNRVTPPVTNPVSGEEVRSTESDTDTDSDCFTTSRQSVNARTGTVFDDDWVTNQAREHIEAHIEFRADAIEYPKAVARSQIPRAVELIRDVLAEDGDVYDIDDALETEWPTFDELYEPTKPASVRRLHDRLKVIA